MMTINYYVTEDDYLDYARFRFKSSPGTKKQVLFTRLLLVAAMLAISLATSRSARELLFLLAFIAPLTALLMFLLPRSLLRSHIRLTRRMMRDGRPPFIGKHALMLGEDRFEHVQSDRASAYAYSCVQRVVTGKRCAFICVSNFAAIIMPLRSFTGPAHEHAFFELLRTHVAQAATQPAEPGIAPPLASEPPADAPESPLAEQPAVELPSQPDPVIPDPPPANPLAAPEAPPDEPGEDDA